MVRLSCCTSRKTLGIFLKMRVKPACSGYGLRRDTGQILRRSNHLCPGQGKNSSFHRRKAVAPLKRQGPDQQQVRRPGFHRRKAVAPLKHQLPGPQRVTVEPGFHRRKAVAPLKRAQQPGLRPGTEPGFHRRKAVAPLKLLELVVAQGRGECFHRRKAVAPLKLGEVDVGRHSLVVSIAERRWLH